MKVDAHCHAYEFSEEELRRFTDVRIISVAEDFESSMRNLELARRYGNLVAFVGIHPWNIGELDEEEVEKVSGLAREAAGIGEVGVDRRYGVKQLKEQLRVFEEFCELAAQLNLPINLHALDSWELCFQTLTRHGVKRAVFHWYNGPSHLLSEIESQGYYISVNPAAEIQPKHMRILVEAELDITLTESDGPYLYRGMRLDPSRIDRLLNILAKVKGVDVEDVEKIVERNLDRFLG